MIRSWCFWYLMPTLRLTMISCSVAYWTKPPAGGRVCLMASLVFFRIAKTQTKLAAPLVAPYIVLALGQWDGPSGRGCGYGKINGHESQAMAQGLPAPPRHWTSQNASLLVGSRSHIVVAWAMAKMQRPWRRSCSNTGTAANNDECHIGQSMAVTGNKIRCQNEVTSGARVLTIML